MKLQKMSVEDIVKNIEAEYLDISSRSAWPLVYQKICLTSQSYPYTCLEAKKPENKALNRYRDVSPYDHTRISLWRGDSDYINANLVTIKRANRKYILTQGPISLTVSHFWLMVWEQESRAILMLNKIVEKNEVKCFWYWPLATGERYKISLPDVNLSVEQTFEKDYQYYTVRDFRITDEETKESRDIKQFHYTTWPDFGVPTSPVKFLNFLTKVREAGVLEPDVGPSVVHCSAGIGRSGTFCLVDSCLAIIENEGSGSLNIQDVLLDMRRDRMGLIQTPEQLRFSYQAIIEGARRLDPNWKPEPVEEDIYSAVAEDDPPPPPPRGESLTRPPQRPLPAIPSSSSMGNLDFATKAGSSADEHPTPPSESNTAQPNAVEETRETQDVNTKTPSSVSENVTWETPDLSPVGTPYSPTRVCDELYISASEESPLLRDRSRTSSSPAANKRSATPEPSKANKRLKPTDQPKEEK